MIEKVCQLMIAPGELVINSRLGEATMPTCPATICEPVGLARAAPPPIMAHANKDAEVRAQRNAKRKGFRRPDEFTFAILVTRARKPRPTARAGAARLSAVPETR